jgi:flagellar capping protein FliD
MSMLDELTNPKSTLETYGASLVGNSTVSNIRSQLRALVTADSSTSASSGGLTALRDIGIEVDKAGKLASNALKLDLALDLNFTNTVTLLSGNQENQSSFDTALRGLAGDASKTIIGLVSSSGTIATESTNATTRITKYKDDLVKLEARMTQVLARYSKQFATMDSMVGQTKSTQTGLTSSFAGLMAMYTNK